MASVKASEQSLVQIEQAMARQKWTWDSDRPLLEASKILEPNRKWDEPGSYANGCSQKSWKRFLQRILIAPNLSMLFVRHWGSIPMRLLNPISKKIGRSPARNSLGLPTNS